MFVHILHRMVRRRLLRHGVRSRKSSFFHGTLHYYEASPANPAGTLVLVHGLGTSASTWVNILPQLAQKYRVLAPDLPGFGFSHPLAGTPTIADFAGSLESFTDATVAEPFILLGHSLGGWITMKYALTRPTSVRRLILMNTAGIYYQGVDELRDLFNIHSTRDTQQLLNHIWVKYPWHFRLLTPFIYRDLVRRKVPELVSSVQREDFMNEDLSKFTMPVSIIWGGREGLIDRKTLRILEEGLPTRTLHVIEESGHVPQLQTPNRLLETLQDILGKI